MGASRTLRRKLLSTKKGQDAGVLRRGEPFRRCFGFSEAVLKGARYETYSHATKGRRTMRLPS